MQYVWLAIMVLSLAPLAIAGFVFNPVTFMVMGPGAWRQRVLQLRPYRRWLATSLAVFSVATLVYGATYGS